jgi:pimeloyl-ACP methyl ester carboxylesterase
VDVWVGDLETVVDAVGLERFALLGVSQGAAIAVAYAARHPDRVSDLVLYGGYARGRRFRGESEEEDAIVAAIRAGWTAPNRAFRRMFSMLFLPNGTPEQMAWHEDLLRRSTTAEAATRLYRARGGVNVCELAAQVRARTLVMHVRDDRVVPVEESRLLARADDMDRDSALNQMPPPIPTAAHEILGGGGLKLRAREWGNPGGPALLLIHGWSQSDLCWLNQVRGDLAGTFRIVTFDLRGHGLSDKPPRPEQYADGQLWADDVAAVIDQTGLEQPTLVAWSYGGYIVADYLRAYGDALIGGINLVGAAVILRPPAFDHIGPGMLENAPEMCVPDLFANTAATRRFLRACTSRPLNNDELAAALAWNMVVPPAVRGALLSRARWQRRSREYLGSRARDTRARRRDHTAVDGQTHAHRLPGRDRVVVRRCRPHAVLGGVGSLRPRTRRPRAPREVTTTRS